MVYNPTSRYQELYNRHFVITRTFILAYCLVFLAILVVNWKTPAALVYALIIIIPTILFFIVELILFFVCANRREEEIELV